VSRDLVVEALWGKVVPIGGSDEVIRLDANAAHEIASLLDPAIREIRNRVGGRYAELHQLIRDELRAQAWDEGTQAEADAMGLSDEEAEAGEHSMVAVCPSKNPYRRPNA